MIQAAFGSLKRGSAPLAVRPAILSAATEVLIISAKMTL
jgi:hypothetical protein